MHLHQTVAVVIHGKGRGIKAGTKERSFLGSTLLQYFSILQQAMRSKSFGPFFLLEKSCLTAALKRGGLFFIHFLPSPWGVGLSPLLTLLHHESQVGPALSHHLVRLCWRQRGSGCPWNHWGQEPECSSTSQHSLKETV